jgi:hypothetical protein
VVDVKSLLKAVAVFLTGHPASLASSPITPTDALALLFVPPGTVVNITALPMRVVLATDVLNLPVTLAVLIAEIPFTTVGVRRGPD